MKTIAPVLCSLGPLKLHTRLDEGSNIDFSSTRDCVCWYRPREWGVLRGRVHLRSLRVTLAHYTLRHSTIDGDQVRAAIRAASDEDAALVRVVDDERSAQVLDADPQV